MTEFKVGDEVVVVSKGPMGVFRVPKNYVGKMAKVTDDRMTMRSFEGVHDKVYTLKFEHRGSVRWVRENQIVLASRIKTKQDLKLYKALAEL